ncbi:MAG: hypothetical protein GY710_24705 [Desulfobacteraceae bacterium]|nr:hypothetical protein [Desulfobacteraceae bacterium]
MQENTMDTILWKPEDGIFSYTYKIEYENGNFTKISVTIDDKDALLVQSPPLSPPETPQTYFIDNKKGVSFNLQSQDGIPLKGKMWLHHCQDGKVGDSIGVFCDLYYGQHFYHHFEGISLTFPSHL